MGRRWSARIALAMASIVVLVPSMGAAAATTALPDLGMAHASDIRIEKTNTGGRVLRFSSTVVNVGAGPFDVRGHRDSTSATDMSITQRIFNSDGSYQDVPATTTMVYGGDGHRHWHVRDLETAELIRLDNGSKVGTGNKRGFCFYDNAKYNLALPGAPQAPVYVSAGCGTATSLDVNMALSVGWGDIYPYTLPDQSIDITNLAAGRYRLQLTAVTEGHFVEADTTNNLSWVDLQIKGQGAPKVLAYGPAA